jgi:putative Mg2+ transporter-C (MgtC) family protein
MLADTALIEIVLKLFLAMLCGGAIGVERELSRKPAGLRTNMLICIAAALFMVTSRYISNGEPYTDPARLVAQAVAGVGFIGAGVILQSRGSITGLTTAATIFIVTAVGIAIGQGMYAASLLTTFLVIFILVMMRRIERILLRSRRLYHYSFKTSDASLSISRLFEFLERESLQLANFSVSDSDEGQQQVAFGVVTSVKHNSQLMTKLQQLGYDIRATTHDETD